MEPKKVLKLKKKYAIILVLILLGVFAVVMGASYAFFTSTVNGKEYVVYSGTLEVAYEKKTNVINMQNARPMTNTEGLATTPYSFDVKNTGTLKEKYQVRLEEATTNTLPLEYVKISVYKNDIEYLKPTKLSDLNSTLVIVDNGLLEGNQKDNYKVRLWVDISTGNDMIGKEFKGRVVIDAMQDVEEGYDVNTRPIITLAKDSNNNTHINLIKGNTFTDPGVESIKDDKDTLLVSNITKTYEYYDGTNLSTVNSINTNNTGVYYITYSILDNEGLAGSAVRVVTVNPTATLPTITLNGSSTVELLRTSTYTDLGVTVGNNIQVATIGEVKTTVPGTYVVKYIAIDKDNNMNSVIRTVSVLPTYGEGILNGSYPVLTDNLIPVTIDNDGTVTKADITSDWYSYQDKEWANAVVLVDNTVNYDSGDTIPESNIESYFVWIPKYSYQLWDLGEYNSQTTIDSTKPHAILIKFGTTDTSDNNNGQCTTPMENNQGVAGSSGNCVVGDYMTHPAFLAFENSTGFWTGKFETGYDGAETKEGAQSNSVNIAKIIIKPNTYSWRNLKLGTIFKNSYDYLRSDESHMIKNTEWGAIVYLSHSIYGKNGIVRNNNNSDYVTGYSSIDDNNENQESTALGINGTYTKTYNTEVGYLASTTGNITGIYDMSGGSLEYIAAYNINTASTTSGITNYYPDFYSNEYYNKYYDKYTTTNAINYNNRILGDAIGELGPFDTNGRSSWYNSILYVPTNWLCRSALYNSPDNSLLATRSHEGWYSTDISFRIVLTPTE